MATKIKIDGWVIAWLILSIVIVFYDVLFVLLRPQTMPGGFLNKYWFIYNNYILIDHSYGDVKNYFVCAQAIMSVGEIIIACVGLIKILARQNTQAALLIFCSVSLTSAKTILILLVEYISGFSNIAHSDLFTQITMYFLPNLLWVIFPVLVARNIYAKFCNQF